MSGLLPWLALFVLGAYHGINPGMGWLFAVALGMQERSRRAVLRSLPPLALGHALSIGLIVALVALLQGSLPQMILRILSSAVLITFGLYRLFRAQHPKWVGMRVGFRDLTLWSFLMASAHGAGLMLLPILLGWSHADHAHHAGHMGGLLSHEQMTALSGPLTWFLAVVVHTLGHLLVTGLVALIIYEKVGLAILRKAWLNLDLIWAIVLVVTGVIIFFV